MARSRAKANASYCSALPIFLGVWALVLGIVVGYLLSHKKAQREPLEFVPLNFSTTGVAVETKEWDHSESPVNFTREIAIRKKPVVLLNSPCTQWNASKLWQDNDYLQDHVLLFSAMEHQGPEWMYEFPTKMIGTDKGLDLQDPPRVSKITETSMQGFLRRISLRSSAASKAPQVMWRRFSALVPLSEKGPFKQIEGDATPRDFLSPVSPDMENANVWLSAEGDVCQTHFDLGENFFYQLRGEQEVSIWSPSMWPVLHHFPFMHVRTRQSQVYGDNSEDFPGEQVRNSSATTLILRAGELLYIPPFFSFRLTTLQTPSIAVNVWSDSYEGTMVKWLLNRVPGSIIQPQSAENLFNNKPKRGESPAKVANEIALLSLYLINTLPAIMKQHGEERPKEAAANLLWTGLIQTRYRMYQEQFGCADKKEGETESTGHFRPEAVCAKPTDQDHHSKAPAESIPGVETATQHTLQLFQLLEKANPGAREMILFDFIEQLSAFVVGPPDMCIYWRCLVRELLA